MTHRVVNYTYGTGNPVLPDGSIDVRDGIDNLQSLDIFMNADEDTYNQRDGEIVKTRAGAVRDIGVQRIGDFTTGCTVTARNQGVLYETDGAVYVWIGALPKVVPASSSPGSTGGISPSGDWVDIGDASAFVRILSLLSEPDGSSFVGFQQAGSGSVASTSQDKLRERITPQDKGAVGDGVTNDQAAFTALESMPAGTEVDLLGKTYLVDVLPVNNRYINGYIKHSVDNYIYDANQHLLLKVGNRTALLAGAGPVMPKWVKYRGPLAGYNVYGIGFDALSKNESGRNCIAIGSGAMHEQVNGRYNVAVGLESQYYVNSDDGAHFNGTRNTSIGDNSMRFNVVGASNCAMGRNASQVVLGKYNVHLGAAAVSGDAPLDLDDQIIVNTSPSTVEQSVVVGVDAGHHLSGGYGQVIFGYKAGYHLKEGIRNIVGGWLAMEEADKLCSYNGKIKSFVSLPGTYTISAGVITITVASNAGVIVGGRVRAALGGHEANFYPVVSLSGSDKVICSTALTGISESGSTTITEIETVTDYGAQTTECIALGNHSMQLTEKCLYAVAVGAFSLRNLKSGQRTTASGAFAGTNLTASDSTTLMGYNAGRYMQSGVYAESLTNVSILGANSSVSGGNQVQLGNSATTTYVYGTVQNRSDERDKADIQDTELGIEFIMGLRPVDGRWDMRDDYWEEYDEQVGVDEEGVAVFETRRRKLPKDGSKARARKHHWFIAQEVKELCDSLGVEFGGYQDHSINGGCDVLSLGYDEFIPPTVKAVQQCWTRLDELENRIANLEN